MCIGGSSPNPPPPVPATTVREPTRSDEDIRRARRNAARAAQGAAGDRSTIFTTARGLLQPESTAGTTLFGSSS